MRDDQQLTPGDEDYTQADEERMDRAAQAGTGGAFGAGVGTSGTTADNMRQDAEDAFGADAESGQTNLDSDLGPTEER